MHAGRVTVNDLTLPRSDFLLPVVGIPDYHCKGNLLVRILGNGPGHSILDLHISTLVVYSQRTCRSGARVDIVTSLVCCTSSKKKETSSWEVPYYHYASAANRVPHTGKVPTYLLATLSSTRSVVCSTGPVSTLHFDYSKTPRGRTWRRREEWKHKTCTTRPKPGLRPRPFREERASEAGYLT